MQKVNYVFTIGYKDDQAIVDKRLKTQYRKLSTMELYEEGLLKPAVASAIFEKEEGRDEELTALIQRMEQDMGEKLDEAVLRKVYGISFNPGDLEKVLLL
ncbi:hypothetical protein [Salinispira pacifica]|uniref:Uncharacterized protein n=1 Tax=Salinispira pacifica TaxID=1307761 RepID=V5WF16_9SPIO|nr:hypothetical protein [Salinispira pacifica]AHC13766.1 hypothetical protein L21SP2_0328 [Salinispira pacifica]